ncbi:acyltransferase family protein [Microlunatus sp. GCM10028923]|uniref:acyltransferase family protein n=1 Tax=Microlunatus sp. GCM10028923 TaxID=3273400 RepID=UPI0036164182
MADRTTESRSKVRDASLDNAKAILIVLVVLGHVIEDVPKDDAAEWLYRVIYLFHMPAFALITGYLSRRFKASIGSYLKLIGALLVPYLVFQSAHGLINARIDNEPFSLDVFDPKWTLWYLLAVALWRALTPLLRAIPYAVPLSILAALGFGLIPNLPDTLSLDRAITLLPFFVIGLTVTPDSLDSVRRVGPLALSAIFLPVAAGVAWWSLDRLGGDDFWFSRSFLQLGDDWLATGLMLRLCSYGLGLLGTAWVLAVAPRRRLPITYLGIQSMYIYLLHSVTLTAFRDNGVIEGLDEPWLVLASIGFAILLSAVLASKPVTVITMPFIQPPFGKIKKREPAPARHRAPARQQVPLWDSVPAWEPAPAPAPEPRPARTREPRRDSVPTWDSVPNWDSVPTSDSVPIWDSAPAPAPRQVRTRERRPVVQPSPARRALVEDQPQGGWVIQDDTPRPRRAAPAPS